eukprot:365799-Chlamydomonas_euryale.AAC.8
MAAHTCTWPPTPAHPCCLGIVGWEGGRSVHGMHCTRLMAAHAAHGRPHLHNPTAWALWEGRVGVPCMAYTAQCSWPPTPAHGRPHLHTPTAWALWEGRVGVPCMAYTAQCSWPPTPAHSWQGARVAAFKQLKSVIERADVLIQVGRRLFGWCGPGGTTHRTRQRGWMLCVGGWFSTRAAPMWCLCRALRRASLHAELICSELVDVWAIEAAVGMASAWRCAGQR